MISLETRRESFEKTDTQTRRETILSAWNGSMTAREIGRKLGFKDLNAVKPRITELVQMGYLEEAGKKFDQVTERNVTYWRKTEYIEPQSKLTLAAAVEALEPRFNIDRPTLSKALRPKVTGITLTPSARSILRQAEREARKAQIHFDLQSAANSGVATGLERGMI